MNLRLLSIILVAWSLGCFGAEETFRDSVLIHFRQSKADIDTSYMDNSTSFLHARQSIKRYHKPDSNFQLINFKVIGGASPEGSVKYNDRLSLQRAVNIYNYMKSGLQLPDSLPSPVILGRDWEGLRLLVEADKEVPFKEEVLTALDNIILNYNNGVRDSEANLSHLKKIGKGKSYRYMYKNIFPSLRESRIILTYGVPEPKIKTNMPLEIDTESEIESLEIISIPEEKTGKNFYIALKTNMLYDLLAVPEGSIEFYLGKNLSIVGNWMYGWWDNNSRHRYWRAYGGDIALRWWFGKAARIKPLTGHHIGVYAGLITYDFEFGGKGYMGGLPGHWLWKRCNHNFGIEYGYSLPIARRLNIDFTLGLGYLGGKYIEYNPENGYYVWEATKNRHYFGPTKLEVSLTWLIGNGNFNLRKGGK